MLITLLKEKCTLNIINLFDECAMSSFDINIIKQLYYEYIAMHIIYVMSRIEIYNSTISFDNFSLLNIIRIFIFRYQFDILYAHT